MPTTPSTAYEDALKTVAKVENESLVEISAVVNDLHSAITNAAKVLSEKRDAMPVVPGPVTSVRSGLDSWIAQIQSSSYQIDQIAIVIRQNLDMYRTAEERSAEMTAASQPTATL
jgi:hypothetical protein